MKKILHLRVITDNLGDDLISHKIQRYFKDKDAQLVEKSYRDIITAKDVEQINKEYDAIIFGGSGIFVNHHLLSGFYLNWEIEAIKKITIPIFIIGAGYNNNFELTRYGKLTNETAESIRHLTNKAEIVWVRDSTTQKNLAHFGIFSINLGCPAMGEIENSVNHKKYITIAIGPHGDFVKSQKQKIITSISETINILINKGFKVIQVKHKEYDYKWYKEIQDKIKSDNFSFYSPANSKELLEIYSQSIRHIGLYLHSNIAAYSVGVQTIILGYDEKCKAFYEDYVNKQTGRYIDIRKLSTNKLLTLFQELDSEPIGYFYKMGDIHKKVIESIWNFII